MKVKYSKITSDTEVGKPKGLRKGIIKSTGDVQNLYSATGIIHEVSPAEFKVELTKLNANICHIYGLPKFNKFVIKTEADKRKMDSDEPNYGITIMRGSNDFLFRDLPSILCWDLDPHNDEEYSRDDLLEMAYEALPNLENHPHIVSVSGSSHLGTGGNDLTGLCGLRLYIFVTRGTDIPTAIPLIRERLWRSGLAGVWVTPSGQIRDDAPMDPVFKSACHLDFAGGSVLEPNVECYAPEPDLYSPDADFYDLSSIPILTTEDESIVYKAKQEAFNEPSVIELSQTRQAMWKNNYVEKELKKNPKADKSHILDMLSRVIDSGNEKSNYFVLPGDFVLHLQGGKEVTVLDLLTFPDRYQRQRMCDPLEPDYRGGSNNVGMFHFYNKDGYPYIQSYAHGGIRYRLKRASRKIVYSDSELSRHLETVLRVLSDEDNIFVYMGKLVEVDVSTGEISSICRHRLRGLLSDLFDFYEWKNVKGMLVETKTAPKIDFCDLILASHTRWGEVKRLVGVSNGSILNFKGVLFNSPGYDSDSRLFNSEISSERSVINTVKRSELHELYNTMMYPFSEFAIANDESRGNLLALILTSVMRLTMDLSPLFILNAPEASSGKSLLAKMIGHLMLGYWPSDLSGSRCIGDEAELSKEIVTGLRSGEMFFSFDDVGNGKIIDSAVLNHLCTTEIYRGRILSLSVDIKVINKSLVVVTGNNISVAADTAARALEILIDTKSEKPGDIPHSFQGKHFIQSGNVRSEVRLAAQKIIKYSIDLHKDDKDVDCSGKMFDFQHYICRAVQDLTDVLELDVINPDVTLREAKADPLTEARRGLFDVIHEKFGLKPFTAKEFMSANGGDALSTDYLYADMVAIDSVKSCSSDLAKMDKRMARNRRFVVSSSASKKKAMTFRLKSMSEGDSKKQYADLLAKLSVGK